MPLRAAPKKRDARTAGLLIDRDSSPGVAAAKARKDGRSSRLSAGAQLQTLSHRDRPISAQNQPLASSSSPVSRQRPVKRRKKLSSSGKKHDDKEYAALRIDDESPDKYYIVWAGTDPSTNKPYQPTWEPKAYANEALVKDWEDQLAQRHSSSKKPDQEQSFPGADSPPVPLRLRRHRKVIESSSQDDPDSHPSTRQQDTSPLRARSSQAFQETGDPRIPSPVAIVGHSLPSDFDPEDYVKFGASQLPLTQAVPSAAPPSSQYEESEQVKTASVLLDSPDRVSLDESQVSGPVIPDSQTPAKALHSGSTTQESTNQSQQSNPLQIDLEDRRKHASESSNPLNAKSVKPSEGIGSSTTVEETVITTSLPSPGLLTALDTLRQKTGVSPRSITSATRSQLAEEPPTAPESTAVIETIESPVADAPITSGSVFHTRSSILKNPTSLTFTQNSVEAPVEDSSSVDPTTVEAENTEVATGHTDNESHLESEIGSSTFQTQVPFLYTQDRVGPVQASKSSSGSSVPAAQPRDEVQDSLSLSDPSGAFGSTVAARETDTLGESAPLVSGEVVTTNVADASEGSAGVKHQQSHLEAASLVEDSDAQSQSAPRKNSIPFLLNVSETSAVPQSGQGSPRPLQSSTAPTNDFAVPHSSSSSIPSRPSQLPTPEPEFGTFQRSGSATRTMPFKATYFTPGKPAQQTWDEVMARSSLPGGEVTSLRPKQEAPQLVESTTKPGNQGDNSEVAPDAISEELDFSIQPPKDFVYFLDLEVRGRVKKLYQDTIRSKKELVRSIVCEKDARDTAEIMLDVQSLITTLHDIASHPDLVYSGSASERTSSDPAVLSRLDVTTSSKFKFLDELLRWAGSLEKHIVIMVKPGYLTEIVETFLQGTQINYSRPRPDGETKKMYSSNSLQVTVLPTNLQGNEYTVTPADLVIALDETFDVNERQVQQVRQRWSDTDPPCVVVVPMVSNSVQHIGRFLTQTEGVEYAKATVLLLHACRLQDAFGGLQPDAPRSDSLGRLIAKSMAALPNGNWDLPQSSDLTLPPIPSELPDTVSGAQSRKRHLSQSSKSSGRSTKQVRIDEDASNNAKSEESMTKVTDSIAPPTTSSPLEVSAADLKHETYLEPSAADAQLKTQLAQLRTELEAVQTRLEEQTRNTFQLEVQMRKLETTNSVLEARRATAEKTISDLKDERKSLNGELAQARSMLANSSVPEQAEYASLRAQALEADGIKKKLHYRSDELEHARKMYQDASARASELASENSALQANNTELERKASGLATELHATLKINTAAAFSAALKKTQLERDTVQQLADEFQSQLEEMRRENAEMKERLERNKGMALSTRASSVPMSGLPGVGPRQGTPTGGSATPGRGPSALARSAVAAAAVSDLRRDATANTASKGRGGSAAGSRQGSRQASPLPRTQPGVGGQK